MLVTEKTTSWPLTFKTQSTSMFPTYSSRPLRAGAKTVRVAQSSTSCSQSLIITGSGPSFRTDAEISGPIGVREKELQPWQPGPESNVNLSLDESALGTWDQFATNEKLYNVQSDYDENLYTTAIDRTTPRYREREAKAARIAREINNSEAANSHVAEERRMNDSQDAGLDEEEKYAMLVCLSLCSMLLTILQIQWSQTRFCCPPPRPDERLCPSI